MQEAEASADALPPRPGCKSRRTAERTVQLRELRPQYFAFSNCHQPRADGGVASLVEGAGGASAHENGQAVLGLSPRACGPLSSSSPFSSVPSSRPACPLCLFLDEDMGVLPSTAEESPFSRAFSRRRPVSRTYTRKKLMS